MWPVTFSAYNSRFTIAPKRLFSWEDDSTAAALAELALVSHKPSTVLYHVSTSRAHDRGGVRSGFKGKSPQGGGNLTMCTLRALGKLLVDMWAASGQPAGNATAALSDCLCHCAIRCSVPGPSCFTPFTCVPCQCAAHTNQHKPAQE